MLDSALCVSAEAKGKLQRDMTAIIKSIKERGYQVLDSPEWLKEMMAEWGPAWNPKGHSGPKSYMTRYAEKVCATTKQ